MKKVFKVVAGIVIAVGILAIGGCVVTLMTANEVVKEIDKTIKVEEQKVVDKDKLLQDMLAKVEPVESKDEYSWQVEYTLTNDSKEVFDYVQLSLDVFDANGTKLGTNMTNMTDIQPGATFKLVVDLYQEGATSYKVNGISSSPF